MFCKSSIRMYVVGLVASLLLCWSAIGKVEELPPSLLLTASDLILNDASRMQAISAALNADALWDTTIQIDNTDTLLITNIVSDNYLLRAIVFYTSDDITIEFIADGINCKYPDINKATVPLRAGKSLTLEIGTVDTIRVMAANDNTDVDFFALAARLRHLAP